MITVQQPVLRPGDVVRPQDEETYVYDSRDGLWRRLYPDEGFKVVKVHGDGRVTIKSVRGGKRTTVLAKHLEVAG